MGCKGRGIFPIGRFRAAPLRPSPLRAPRSGRTRRRIIRRSRRGPAPAPGPAAGGARHRPGPGIGQGRDEGSPSRSEPPLRTRGLQEPAGGPSGAAAAPGDGRPTASRSRRLSARLSRSSRPCPPHPGVTMGAGHALEGVQEPRGRPITPASVSSPGWGCERLSEWLLRVLGRWGRERSRRRRRRRPARQGRPDGAQIMHPCIRRCINAGSPPGAGAGGGVQPDTSDVKFGCHGNPLAIPAPITRSGLYIRVGGVWVGASRRVARRVRAFVRSRASRFVSSCFVFRVFVFAFVCLFVSRFRFCVSRFRFVARFVLCFAFCVRVFCSYVCSTSWVGVSWVDAVCRLGGCCQQGVCCLPASRAGSASGLSAT